MGAGLGVTFTGCIEDTSGSPTTTLSETTTQMNPEAHVPDEWHEALDQGTAEPVETNISIRDDVTYYPDEEKVEIDDGVFRPAAEWVRTECPYAAVSHVNELLDKRLSDLESITIGRNQSLLDEDILLVSRIVLFDREGTIVTSPNITFDALQKATPRRVVATVTLDRFKHTCRFPIYVRDRVEQYD